MNLNTEDQNPGGAPAPAANNNAAGQPQGNPDAGNSDGNPSGDGQNGSAAVDARNSLRSNGHGPDGSPSGRSLMSRDAKAGQQPEGRDAGQQEQNGNKQDGQEKPDDPAAKVPDKPEGYDLKFAPETQVDNDLLGDFRKTAKEIGLTQGQAQKLGSMYEARMSEVGKRMVEAQTQAMLEARKGWEAEITKRPAFEAERGHIRAAMRQFGDKELFDLLDQTNLGSHPKMWDFMAKVGKALAEPGFRGENTGQAKSAAEVLYPNMNH